MDFITEILQLRRNEIPLSILRHKADNSMNKIALLFILRSQAVFMQHKNEKKQTI